MRVLNRSAIRVLRKQQHIREHWQDVCNPNVRTALQHDRFRKLVVDLEHTWIEGNRRHDARNTLKLRRFENVHVAHGGQPVHQQRRIVAGYTINCLVENAHAFIMQIRVEEQHRVLGLGAS